MLAQIETVREVHPNSALLGTVQDRLRQLAEGIGEAFGRQADHRRAVGERAVERRLVVVSAAVQLHVAGEVARRVVHHLAVHAVDEAPELSLLVDADAHRRQPVAESGGQHDEQVSDAIEQKPNCRSTQDPHQDHGPRGEVQGQAQGAQGGGNGDMPAPLPARVGAARDEEHADHRDGIGQGVQETDVDKVVDAGVADHRAEQLARRARGEQHLSAFGLDQLVVLDHRDPVDDDMGDPFGVDRSRVVLVRAVTLDLVQVEHREVGLVAVFGRAPIQRQQITALDFPVGDEGVRRGAVGAGSHDGRKGQIGVGAGAQREAHRDQRQRPPLGHDHRVRVAAARQPQEMPRLSIRDMGHGARVENVNLSALGRGHQREAVPL